MIRSFNDTLETIKDSPSLISQLAHTSSSQEFASLLVAELEKCEGLDFSAESIIIHLENLTEPSWDLSDDQLLNIGPRSASTDGCGSTRNDSCCCDTETANCCKP